MISVNFLLIISTCSVDLIQYMNETLGSAQRRVGSVMQTGQNKQAKGWFHQHFPCYILKPLHPHLWIPISKTQNMHTSAHKPVQIQKFMHVWTNKSPYYTYMHKQYIHSFCAELNKMQKGLLKVNDFFKLLLRCFLIQKEAAPKWFPVCKVNYLQ